MGCGGSKGKKAKAHHLKELKMEDTYIRCFNEVFEASAAPLNQLVELNNALYDGMEAFETLIAYTDMKYAVKKLKKDLKHLDATLYLELTPGGYLYIRLDVDCPPHIKEIYDAFCTLIDSLKTVIETIPNLIEQITELVEKTVDFPDRAKDEAQSAGLSAMQIIKCVKNTPANCAKLAKAPKICQTLLDTARATVRDLQEGFNDIADNMEKNVETVEKAVDKVEKKVEKATS